MNNNGNKTVSLREVHFRYESFNLLKPAGNYFLDAKMRMAYILERQGKLEKAIALLRETIEHHRESPNLYLMLASLYEVREEYLIALDVLREGLEYNKENTDLLYRFGVVLDKLERNAECLEHMEMVIKIDPHHADALNYIGYTYADKGVYLDKALELIQKALKYKPKSGYIIDSLGWVYFKKGLYDEALVELKKAVELAPEDPAINEHLGDVYLKKREYDNALKVFKKTLSLKNSNQERLKSKINTVIEHMKGALP